MTFKLLTNIYTYFKTTTCAEIRNKSWARGVIEETNERINILMSDIS